MSPTPLRQNLPILQLQSPSTPIPPPIINTTNNQQQVFLAALLIFELGSLICALAKWSEMLIIGRTIAGMGGAGLILGFLTILAASAPLDKRPSTSPPPSPLKLLLTKAEYLGIVMGIASLGIVLGPILGGILTEKATWRWCFWINLPVGAITALILSFIKIPDSKIKDSHLATRLEQVKRLDLPGFVIFSPAIVMLLLALQWGGATYAWSSGVVIGLFVGAGVGWCLFLLWEMRQGERVFSLLFPFQTTH